MSRKVLLIGLILLSIVLAACGSDSEFSEADAEKGVNAAFAGNRDEAANYICEKELTTITSDTAVPEGVNTEVSCQQDEDQMRCEIGMSGVEDEEPLTMTVTFDIEDGKLCNAVVTLLEE